MVTVVKFLQSRKAESAIIRVSAFISHDEISLSLALTKTKNSLFSLLKYKALLKELKQDSSHALNAESEILIISPFSGITLFLQANFNVFVDFSMMQLFLL